MKTFPKAKHKEIIKTINNFTIVSLLNPKAINIIGISKEKITPARVQNRN